MSVAQKISARVSELGDTINAKNWDRYIELIRLASDDNPANDIAADEAIGIIERVGKTHEEFESAVLTEKNIRKPARAQLQKLVKSNAAINKISTEVDAIKASLKAKLLELDQAILEARESLGVVSSDIPSPESVLLTSCLNAHLVAQYESATDDAEKARLKQAAIDS